MSESDERFTQRAKQILIIAGEQAAIYGDSHVKPEHMLLALLQEGTSVAIKVLERMGISAGRIVQEITRQMPPSPSPLESLVVTFDPRLKRVLDFAADEARQANTSYVATEHLLLGIIREGDGIAFRTLAKLGIDIISARKEVVKYLGGSLKPPAARPQLRYEIRKYSDPARASEWLNDMIAQDYKLLYSSTSKGEMWIILEGSVPRAEVSGDSETAASAAPDAPGKVSESEGSDAPETGGDSSR